MFARFRDENALMDRGFVMPVALRTSASAARPESDSPDGSDYHTLILDDGRRLAWAEFGHQHGYPVLYMHRQGGCRLEALFLHDAAKAAGFRLIAVDRPGLGGSDFLSFKDPAVLASDYIQLMDLLGLSQVAVFAWGSGGRFALSMAARFPQRISFLNLLSPRERSCSLGTNRLLGIPFRIALRLLLSVRTSRAQKYDERYLQRWREQMCYTDRKQLDDPDVRSLLARIARESTSQGVAGLAQDIWFGMTAVDIASAVPVHIWQGSADTVSRPQIVYPGECGKGSSDRGIFRHWVRRQGYLFFRQAAGDIFRVARREAGVNPGAGDPLRH